MTMATTTPEQHFGTVSREHGRHFLAELTAGSTSEAIAGAGAAILAIIGLAHMAPLYMMAIGVIVLGAAFLFEGGVVMARFAERVSQFGAAPTEKAEVGGGISAEVLGGMAGIVLGVLALIGIVPQILCSAAILVFGGCMLVSAAATGRTREMASLVENRSLEVGREATAAASETEGLVGLAAVVLGILAVCGIAPQPLTLIAILVLGAGLLVSGSAMSTQWLSGMRWTR
jgi:hypothetical protein